jgi:hypothetical protein
MSEYNGVLYPVPPPQGLVPNPDAPYEATPVIAVACVFFPLAFITTCIRVYTRVFIVRQFVVDDCELTRTLSMTPICGKADDSQRMSNGIVLIIWVIIDLMVLAMVRRLAYFNIISYGKANKLTDSHIRRVVPSCWASS